MAISWMDGKDEDYLSMICFLFTFPKKKTNKNELSKNNNFYK